LKYCTIHSIILSSLNENAIYVSNAKSHRPEEETMYPHQSKLYAFYI
jgi:hypothetical protein